MTKSKKTYSKKVLNQESKSKIVNDIAAKAVENDLKIIRKLTDAHADIINREFANRYKISIKKVEQLLHEGYLQGSMQLSIRRDKSKKVASKSRCYVNNEWCNTSVGDEILYGKIEAYDNKYHSIRRNISNILDTFKTPHRIVENVPEMADYFDEVYPDANIIPYKQIEEARNILKGVNINNAKKSKAVEVK